MTSLQRCARLINHLRPATTTSAHTSTPLHRTLSTSPTSSQPATTPPTYHLLTYRYVDNMTTRRTPVRPLHLQHASHYVAAGQLLLGGAVPPEVKEAVLVFKGLDRAGVEGFARADPYVLKGLVEEWAVKEWTVVVGSAM